MSVKVDVQKIGTFSKLYDRTTIPDELPPRLNEDSRLKGLLSEELDLTIGFDGFKDAGYGDRFHSFFDYIKKTSKQGFSLKGTIGADFVSNRRNLLVIARSPYAIEEMEIQAIRKNGVIFLCDKAIDREDRAIPYGYKFEQYMTLDENGKPHDKYKKVSNAECAKSVFRTTLTSGKDKLKLFYAAEMDAIDKNGNFVEMKTTALGHYKWLEKQSLYHYLQSYFADVPYIIYGRKTNFKEQLIYKIDKVWTDNIPKYRVNWNKETCFKQLFDVLKKINTKLEYDDEALVLQVTKQGLFFEPECSNNCTFMDPQFLDHFTSSSENTLHR